MNQRIKRVFLVVLLSFTLIFTIVSPGLVAAEPTDEVTPMDLIWEFMPAKGERFARFKEDLPSSIYVTIYHLGHRYAGHIPFQKVRQGQTGYTGLYEGMIPYIR